MLVLGFNLLRLVPVAQMLENARMCAHFVSYSPASNCTECVGKCYLFTWCPDLLTTDLGRVNVFQTRLLWKRTSINRSQNVKEDITEQVVYNWVCVLLLQYFAHTAIVCILQKIKLHLFSCANCWALMQSSAVFQ